MLGFFEGEFTIEELESFMGELAESSGTAPMAGRYFKKYNPEFDVNTIGIVIQKTMVLPNTIQEIIDEFNDIKFIDEATYHLIETKWYGTPRAMQAVRLLEKE